MDLQTLCWIAGGTVAALLAGALVLHAIPRFGPLGKRISDALCFAPALDVLITYFTIVPMIVGPILAGWPGLVAAIVGQFIALLIWEALHTLAHPEARRGPRIVRIHNQSVGAWRNYLAVWITAIAVPGFWIVRVCQWVVYPPLTWLVKLPPYRHAEWVNVSRHKFEGLVGHDLIWCLYCDWMTGIWSLGSEMLRNVESFWCPIRFRSDKKCANCAVDFPDINNGWAPADGAMSDVAAVLREQYGFVGEPNPAGDYHPWFGHPARLTVERRQIDQPQ